MPREKPNLPDTSPTGPSVELSTNAVVAAYIHEISERHRPPALTRSAAGATRSGRRRGRAAPGTAAR